MLSNNSFLECVFTQILCDHYSPEQYITRQQYQALLLKYCNWTNIVWQVTSKGLHIFTNTLDDKHDIGFINILLSNARILVFLWTFTTYKIYLNMFIFIFNKRMYYLIIDYVMPSWKPSHIWFTIICIFSCTN